MTDVALVGEAIRAIPPRSSPWNGAAASSWPVAAKDCIADVAGFSASAAAAPFRAELEHHR